MSYQRINFEDFASSPLSKYTDLASSALGTTIVEVTNEFFAPAINMINPKPPVHAPGKFVGKLYCHFSIVYSKILMYHHSYWCLDGWLGNQASQPHL